MNDRIDIEDLVAQLGPGLYNLEGETVVVCDGAGEEVTVKIEEGTMKVEVSSDTKRKSCNCDEPIEVNFANTYEIKDG